MGPMRAARRFLKGIEGKGRFAEVQGVKAELYGSLALTGKGHGTDRAVVLGLMGEAPDELDPATVDARLSRVRELVCIPLLGTRNVPFDCEKDLVFRLNEVLPGHANGMRFTAYGRDGDEIDSQVFYSVGGGFIKREGEEQAAEGIHAGGGVPYPFRSAADLLRFGSRDSKPIWQMVLENETVARSEEEVAHSVFRIWNVMKDCIDRGLNTGGILPGGLNVRRRAPQLHALLHSRVDSDPLATVDWINVFAMAVNEENAAGGRVVTAPTNGAAGIIPAVCRYYEKFVHGADEKGILRFFLTAGAIGILYKENASISGAEVGCQGEVGVACSMAAAGLVAAMEGTNEQVEHAAEIGMEHNLGMTCDPIGGLVQIPCIERNAIGAVKAVNAARMAMRDTGQHKVSLDDVILTMHQTGRDMQARYKETALAGLAVHVNVVEC